MGHISLISHHSWNEIDWNIHDEQCRKDKTHILHSTDDISTQRFMNMQTCYKDDNCCLIYIKNACIEVWIVQTRLKLENLKRAKK